jgi:transposase
MRKSYPTDLSDDEWSRLRSYLPSPKAQGRPRTHSLRDVLDAIFYVLKSGCHWRLLPPRLPSVDYRLLPFQEIPIKRAVVPHPQVRAYGREE